MRFIKVVWNHSHQNEPVLLYSELNDERFEVRKVETFTDGHWGYASAEEESGGSVLGSAPVPSLEEIASDPQFDPVEITRDEFERIWADRRTARQ